MENQIFKVYKIVNKINGKLYIGCTSRNLLERFSEHLYESSRGVLTNIVLYKAIKKYGKNNFYIEELEICKSEKEMYQKEIEYIEKYQTFFKYNKGYNMTLGGEGLRGVFFSEKTRKIMSQNTSNYHKINLEWHQKVLNNLKPTKESIEKFILMNKTRFRPLEELESKRQKMLTKRYPHRQIKFKVISPEGIIYERSGIKRFCQEHGLERSSFTSMVKGKYKQYKGWKLA